MNQFDNYDQSEKENVFLFKKTFFKYLFFWKFFVVSVFVFLLSTFFYLKYTNEVFSSTAKIKILDKKENNLELPSAEDLFSKSKINLENEVEVIASSPILGRVVRNLNLTTSVVGIGNIQKTMLVNFPFKITSNISQSDVVKSKFGLNWIEGGLQIIDFQNNEKEYLFESFSTIGTVHDLPFEVNNFDKEQWSRLDNESYEIKFSNIKSVVSQLKKDILIAPIGKKSDIISLTHYSTQSSYSQSLLNEIIYVFNNDGVKDRQLIHKRTIDFVNDRYAYLSLELDSIETKKESFKIDNNLVDISVNTNLSLQQSFKSEENVFSIENELSITEALINTLRASKVDLLPSNIGIENKEINQLIAEYNLNVLKRNKLILSAGSNNPLTVQIENLLKNIKSNIIFSLDNHLNQLQIIRSKYFANLNKFDDEISNLPLKEKILREIDRNQTIKESLYLFLLQKREEAEVSFAVTEPSIKVIEEAITKNDPISPKGSIIYIFALILGLIIPFLIIYIIFLLDNKVQSNDDIDTDILGGSFLGSIPFVDVEDKDTLFSDANNRSPVAESFRMLASNLKYILTDNDTTKVIIATSTVKGEGKTFNALNLSLCLASLGNKVLLVGADLRNPQLHKYLGSKKNIPGLSSFLIDEKSKWKEHVLNNYDNFPNHSVLLSGPVPPNPLQLLNNGNLEKFLNDAKKSYDYIILDTAPTLLVSDTITISHLSDAIVFLVKANLTEKELLNFSKDLIKEGKLKNVGYVLNGIGTKNKYGYSYGYSYGYQYSYNYGYGYGYSADED